MPSYTLKLLSPVNPEPLATQFNLSLFIRVLLVGISSTATIHVRKKSRNTRLITIAFCLLVLQYDHHTFATSLLKFDSSSLEVISLTRELPDDHLRSACLNLPIAFFLIYTLLTTVSIDLHYFVKILRQVCLIEPV